MFDLQGKRVTIAGKLAGKYAGKSVKMLGYDLERFFGAELVQDFDKSADVAILGAKSKGFLKRIQKAGMAMLSEPQLQLALEEAETTAKSGRPAKKKPVPSRYSLFERFAAIRHRPREERRDALIAAIEEVAGHGASVGLDPSASSIATDGNAVLVWFAIDGAELWAVPSSANLDALRAVDGRTVHTGDDCPPDVLAAAMRVLVATGHRADSLSDRFRLALEDVGATVDLESLRAIDAWPTDHRITAMAAIPSQVHDVFAVYDDIQW